MKRLGSLGDVPAEAEGASERLHEWGRGRGAAGAEQMVLVSGCAILSGELDQNIEVRTLLA